MPEILKESENTDTPLHVPPLEPTEETQPQGLAMTQGDDHEVGSVQDTRGSSPHPLHIDDNQEENEDEDDEEENIEYDEADDEESEDEYPTRPQRPKYTRVQEMQRKATLLHQLKNYTKSGEYSSIDLNMSDSLEDIETEVYRLQAEKHNEATMTFVKGAFLTGIQGLELLSKKQSLVDVRLDGLSTAISCESEMGRYDDVFMELIEKYGASCSNSPELKLVFMLVTAAFGVDMANRMGDAARAKASTPKRKVAPAMNRPTVAVEDILGKPRWKEPMESLEREMPSVDEVMTKLQARRNTGEKRPFQDDHDGDDNESVASSKRSRRSNAPSPQSEPRRSPSPVQIPSLPEKLTYEDILGMPDDPQPAAAEQPVPKKKRAPRKPKITPPPQQQEMTSSN